MNKIQNKDQRVELIKSTMLMFILDCLKDEKMCNNAVDNILMD